MNDTTTAKLATKRPRKMARDAEDSKPLGTAPCSPAENKPKSKADTILYLLLRPEGATLNDLIAATGWLPHTTRAALTGLRKKGHTLTSEKIDDVRRYRIDGGHEEAGSDA
jgi:hypothetical protein